MIHFIVRKQESFNPDIVDVVLTSQKNSIDRLNIVFFELDTTTLLPYCLFVLRNAEQEEANKIFGLLETYIIRRMLCHDWTKNYNKRFKTLLTNKIVTYNALYQNIVIDSEILRIECQQI